MVVLHKENQLNIDRALHHHEIIPNNVFDLFVFFILEVKNLSHETMQVKLDCLYRTSQPKRILPQRDIETSRA